MYQCSDKRLCRALVVDILLSIVKQDLLVSKMDMLACKNRYASVLMLIYHFCSVSCVTSLWLGYLPSLTDIKLSDETPHVF